MQQDDTLTDMLTERRHEAAGVVSRAVYSADERYRYSLERQWDPARPVMTAIMLNPSTATEAKNDPTVARVERRARMGGFGALRVTNIFSLRATDPAELYGPHDPIGPETDRLLAASAEGAGLILCGWGAHGTLLDRGAAVVALLRGAGHTLSVLGLTRAGLPRHPLYVGYGIAPRPWD